MHSSREKDRFIRWPLHVVLLISAIGGIVGCAQFEQFLAPPSPTVAGKWAPVLDAVRSFERRIGFRETPNFSKVATDRTSYPFCGRASNRRLPYSYQDGIIEWPEIEHEAQCRDVAADIDVHFGQVEAWGEIGTPLTAAMLAGTLDRFVYLVIHEDCHDQFDLPYGIEEPLCDILTHRAMADFASERFRWYTLEHRAIRKYTRQEARNIPTTIAHYERMEALYRRFERGEIAHDALLKQRGLLLADAERDLNMEAGQLNNISLANLMTYSRHYPALQRAARAWDHDLPGMIRFFREVDARKPAKEAVLARLGIADERSPAFLRAYEAAVLDTMRGLANAI